MKTKRQFKIDATDADLLSLAKEIYQKIGHFSMDVLVQGQPYRIHTVQNNRSRGLDSLTLSITETREISYWVSASKDGVSSRLNNHAKKSDYKDNLPRFWSLLKNKLNIVNSLQVLKRTILLNPDFEYCYNGFTLSGKNHQISYTDHQNTYTVINFYGTFSWVAVPVDNTFLEKLCSFLDDAQFELDSITKATKNPLEDIVQSITSKGLLQAKKTHMVEGDPSMYLILNLSDISLDTTSIEQRKKHRERIEIHENVINPQKYDVLVYVVQGAETLSAEVKLLTSKTLEVNQLDSYICATIEQFYNMRKAIQSFSDVVRRNERSVL